MIPTIPPILLAIPLVIQVTVGVALSLAVVLAFARLVWGPTLPDRVVALDLLTTLSVGIIAAYAVLADAPVYIDVAVVVALIGFVSAVAFAKFIERRTLLSQRRSGDKKEPAP